MTRPFLSELAKYGPESHFSPFTEEDAVRYCRRLARSHYENFSVVSRLLPRRLREPFFIVYAYCRWSDDLGDEVGDAEKSLRLLDWWEEELRKAFRAGRASSDHSEEGERVTAESRLGGNKTPSAPIHPVMVALARLFRRFPTLPVEPFCDLLVAFRQDQRRTSYETMGELLDYCRFSANPVGRILLYLMKGEPTASDLRASDSICSGLQLANFWQDLRRDRQRGRDYLPKEIQRRFPDPKERMIFLTSEAERLLLAGRPLLGSVPRDVKFDITLFIEGGLAILRKIRQIDYKVDERRPRLTKIEKGILAFRALKDSFRRDLTKSKRF